MLAKKERVMNGHCNGSLLAWNSEGRHALIGEISTLDTILSLRILLRLHGMVTEMLMSRARHADQKKYWTLAGEHDGLQRKKVYRNHSLLRCRRMCVSNHTECHDMNRLERECEARECFMFARCTSTHAQLTGLGR